MDKILLVVFATCFANLSVRVTHSKEYLSKRQLSESQVQFSNANSHLDTVYNEQLNCDVSVDKDYHGIFVDCSRRRLTAVNQSLFPANTTTLVLDDNDITVLANDSFTSMTKLHNLRIRSSNVQSIEVDSLRGLINLESLNLENNNLPIKKHAFPKTMFRHVPNLRELYIASNTPKMSDHWFDGNRTENFQEPYFPDVIDIFRDLPELTKLTIDALPVLRVGTEFRNLSRLSSLELYCIAVFVALNDSFIGLLNSSVRELSLLKSSDIFAASLPSGIFQHVTGLESIHFDTYQVGVHNILKTLWPFANRNMSQIVINYVTYSRYAESPTVTFEDGIIRRSLIASLGNVCVRKIVLANSKLLAVEPGIFLTGSLRHCLRTIDLSANYMSISGWRGLLFEAHRLTAIEDFTLTGIPAFYRDTHTSLLNSQGNVSLVKNLLGLKNVVEKNTETINAVGRESRQKIYTVDELIANKVQRLFWIRFPKTVKSIRLDYITQGPFLVFGTLWLVVDAENIEELYVTNMPNFLVCQARILGLESLRLLDASGSKIDVEDYFYDDFPNLEVLLLSSVFPGNYFENGVSLKRILQNLKKISYLDISRNGLNSIPQGTFSSSFNLKHISLANNRFSVIPFDILSLPNLKFIDLSDNAVPFLKDNEMNDMDEQERRVGEFSLRLNGNAILCLCSDIRFLGWLRSTLVKLDDKGNYKCTSEDGVITSTVDFPDAEAFWRVCAGSNMLLISLILAAVMGIGFLCVYLACRFKTSILGYVLQLVAPQFRTMSPRDYKTGVFLGYADEDYRFVARHLTRFLEEDLGVSTFVHQRDLGTGYTDQLFYEAIQNSWRILLVITATFLHLYNMASIVMKFASHAVSPVNQRRVFVLVEETQVNNIPNYLHDVLDDTRIIVLHDLDSPLSYEQGEWDM